jgi:hypothetical protein
MRVAIQQKARTAANNGHPSSGELFQTVWIKSSEDISNFPIFGYVEETIGPTEEKSEKQGEAQSAGHPGPRNRSETNISKIGLYQI